jgi:GGDEF domain-containing protein
MSVGMWRLCGLGPGGRDEFNVLLDNLTDPSEAIALAERILESLEKPFPLSETEIFISSSIGILYSNWDCATIDDLVKAADRPCTRRNRRGKPSMKFIIFGSHPRSSGWLRRCRNHRTNYFSF